MNLREKIQKDINLALKTRDKKRLSVLRFLQSQIQNKEIEKKRKKLNNQEIITLILNQVKKLKESLTLFQKGKRGDLINQTKKEIAILQDYLPEQLSDEELEKEIEKIIQENPSVSNRGAIIGLCIKALAGRADNQRIAQMVNKTFRLQSSKK